MKNVRKNIIKLLSDLVKIYSPYFEEEQIMKFTYNWLKEKNISCEYHRYSEDRITKFQGTNVVGNIKGKEGGLKILLNGHLDTVTLSQGWTKDPMKAIIEGDKLYGLGALDMKGGSAAIMIALEAFQRNVKDFKGEVVYTLVSDEEGPYGLGTDAIILDGITDGIDFSIVTEPSSGFADIEFPCLCLGARGGYNYKVNFYGKSSHAAAPELGMDAILDGAKLICELEKIELKEDPQLGKGSLVVIETSGGGQACSVAEQSSFTVFRHVVRGEDKEFLINEVKEAAKKAGIKGEYKMEFREAPHDGVDGFKPFTIEEDNIFAKEFLEVIKKVTGTCGNIAYFSSVGDFNYLGTRTGAPVFIFGPYGKNYHSSDEWVSIDSLVKTSQVIYDLLVKLLKV
ncbi:M20/M25/M40 family metallo-hydrolase [Schnuerera sp. xch1]|uniref:M20 family metallopeptidase n=1 Tax=Schnuerera sp. xch1 TaxID=2874283 RepID=UPI001CBF505B|nr:M20/M25/M40 family metallo-hydrolase [Schnuerera sp. xch1]MBZ2175095.1 M20/M25/M40 family metallo-hydrolase [Schnuerera sp. xch1]